MKAEDLIERISRICIANLQRLHKQISQGRKTSAQGLDARQTVGSFPPAFAQFSPRRGTVGGAWQYEEVVLEDNPGRR